MKYLKKIVKQDVEKTFFISKEAFEVFFDEKPLVKEKEAINLLFNGTELTAELQNEGESDFRIIKFKNKITKKAQRPAYEIGDLILFNKRTNLYEFNVIKPNSNEYSNLNNQIGTKNHLIIESDKKIPLNQILYGPPGTGKTYSTIEESLQIIGKTSGINKNNKPKDYAADNANIFRSFLNTRIFFVTMHPSYSYEDFIQGFKPDVNKSDELIFKPKDGIFKRVSDLAKENYLKCKLKKDPNLKVDYDTVLKYAFDLLIKGEIDAIEIPRTSVNFKIININDQRLRFETSTGNSGPTYNISRETLKRIYDKGINDIILSGNGTYYDAMLDFLNSKSVEYRAKELKPIKEIDECGNINYVIILDEINRANISKVFGELITLVEDDKRIGEENELSVKLPSDAEFSVPPNLYILGTMNTADKSISLVDIALRRRFQFIAKYPDKKIILASNESDKEKKADLMEKLNAELRKTDSDFYKGIDFQIGHAYFLKGKSINEIVDNNIIPLLTEYYRNDLTKVSQLLKKADVETIFDENGMLKLQKI